MRKLERTSEKKMLISIALEWDLRALHEVPHYHNLFVKASATHQFPAHYIQNEAGTFFFHPLCALFICIKYSDAATASWHAFEKHPAQQRPNL